MTSQQIHEEIIISDDEEILSPIITPSPQLSSEEVIEIIETPISSRRFIGFRDQVFTGGIKKELPIRKQKDTTNKKLKNKYPTLEISQALKNEPINWQSIWNDRTNKKFVIKEFSSQEF